MMRYLLTILIPVAAVSALFLLADWLSGFRIWYSYEKAYTILRWIKDNAFTLMLLSAFIVGIVFSIIFIRRPLKYI